MIVSFVTEWTTPFAASSSSKGVALICVFLSSLRNALPMNWCNAPLDMPARGGLMLVLPYNFPLHVCKDDSAAAAASLCSSASSWVTGAGAGFPFGLQKL